MSEDIRDEDNNELPEYNTWNNEASEGREEYFEDYEESSEESFEGRLDSQTVSSLRMILSEEWGTQRLRRESVWTRLPCSFFSRPTPIGGPWASHWLNKGGGRRNEGREGPLAPWPIEASKSHGLCRQWVSGDRGLTRSPGREYTHRLRTCYHLFSYFFL